MTDSKLGAFSKHLMQDPSWKQLPVEMLKAERALMSRAFNVGALICSLFIFLDIALFPQNKLVFSIIRLVVSGVASGASFLLWKYRHETWLLNWLPVIVYTVATAGVLSIVRLADSLGEPHYALGLALPIFWAHAFLQARPSRLGAVTFITCVTYTLAVAPELFPNLATLYSDGIVAPRMRALVYALFFMWSSACMAFVMHAENHHVRNRNRFLDGIIVARQADNGPSFFENERVFAEYTEQLWHRAELGDQYVCVIVDADFNGPKRNDAIGFAKAFASLWRRSDSILYSVARPHLIRLVVHVEGRRVGQPEEAYMAELLETVRRRLSSVREQYPALIDADKWECEARPLRSNMSFDEVLKALKLPKQS